MKKSILAMTSVLALVGAMQAPVASAALTNILYKWDCPNHLNNLSSFLSGIGEEQIGTGTQKTLEFKGSVPAGTPLDMSSYSNSNTKYDECTGKVTCQYRSSEGWPVVYVSLDASNAKHGIVIRETAKEIDVKVPAGLTASK